MERYHLSSSAGVRVTNTAAYCKHNKLPSFGAAVKDFPWSTAGEERDGQKAFFVWFLKARFFPRVTVTVVRELTTFCCLLGQ